VTDPRGKRARRAAGAAPPRPLPTFDLYRTLGVRSDATHQEIVEAAEAMDRRLRTANARDRGGSTARQKRFNVARYWLTDSSRRRAYDASVASAGMAGAAASGGPAVGRVRGRVGPGRATRRGAPTSTPWLNRPVTWIGLVALAVVAVVLVLRPGGFGGGSSSSTAPSGGASNSASGSGLAGIPAGCPKSQPSAAPAGQQQVATIATPKGSIEITLTDDLSPIAVGNFVALASCHYYDGVVFHRVVANFVIQGGDGQYGRQSTYASGKAGTGGPGYTIQDEPVTTQYSRGTVAMARTAQPNSVGSQFFIVLSDAARESLASANTYQIIGTVTKGMEVADAIAAAADAENPTDPVVMTSVTVSPPVPATSRSPGGSIPATSSGSAPAASPS
jgi:cyclophilin family peptidyl-prolyl cis-trans isomerase